MSEEVKRLTPLTHTLRELYLKSGNQCAFPGCNSALFNHEGNFVGQVCHIEAAEEGGERFNENQTNEDRRHFSNLMLMCYSHHVETNKEDQYSVETLKRFKADHEKKFSDVVGTMLRSITDHTTLVEARFAVNLNKLNRVLGWNNDKEEMEECVDEFTKMVDKFVKIPLLSRELFCILVKRSHSVSSIGGACLEVSLPDVQQATGMDPSTIRDCFSILDRNGFTCDNDTDDFGVQLVGICSLWSGWPIWEDIKKFCKKEHIDIAQIIISLDFSVLDD